MAGWDSPVPASLQNDRGEKMKLNLGCGMRYTQGYVNIDISEKVKADLILDLEDGKLPYKDNSVDEIQAKHLLEHIRNLIPLMNECYRVLARKGMFHIVVPQGEGIWADPTHVRGFSELSCRYFCGYGYPELCGITCKFRFISQNYINNEDGGVLEIALSK